MAQKISGQHGICSNASKLENRWKWFSIPQLFNLDYVLFMKRDKWGRWSFQFAILTNVCERPFYFSNKKCILWVTPKCSENMKLSPCLFSISYEENNTTFPLYLLCGDRKCCLNLAWKHNFSFTPNDFCRDYDLLLFYISWVIKVIRHLYFLFSFYFYLYLKFSCIFS